MGIDVQRGGRLAVTQQACHRGHIRAVGNQQAGVSVPQGVDITVSGEMLFAPLVFVAVLLLCIVLNTLSALVPAWHSLRKPIINALNEKR